MRLLFRMMISAAVKAVVAREIWAQPMSQRPRSLLCEVLSLKLGKPLPLCCISPGSFPRAVLSLLDQEAEEALGSPSWEIFQAKREPWLARLPT